MDKQLFGSILQESKSLLKHADTNQRLELLRIIKEAYTLYKTPSSDAQIIVESNSDYLEER